jgi:MYXO-CTERM domain-containing protein
MISVDGSTPGPGALHGTLTWDDDVASHYVVPVDLEYISTGTAISPASIDFGQIAVNFSSATQRIVLQNCDDTPVMLDRVVVTEGDRNAWDLQPPIMAQLVPPHATITLAVAFQPHRGGHFASHVDIDVGGATQHVFLNGDAIGGLDASDFYACSCSGRDAPSRGWPIVVAALVVVRRRRRST